MIKDALLLSFHTNKCNFALETQKSAHRIPIANSEIKLLTQKLTGARETFLRKTGYIEIVRFRLLQIKSGFKYNKLEI